MMEMSSGHGSLTDGTSMFPTADDQGTFWSSEDAAWQDLSPEESRELEQAYSAYETKAMQTRQFQKAKRKSRSFYPVPSFTGKGMSKGKGKSKSKRGKGKATSSSTSTSLQTSSAPLFSAQADVMNATGGHSGCFICGDKSHGFRNCLKRGSQQSSGGKGFKKSYMVEALTPSPLSTVFMAGLLEPVIWDTTGYGVLDLP